MKRIISVFLMLMFTGVALWAGTDDALGASALWTKIESILNDKYVIGILTTLCIAVGIMRAIAGAFLQFFIMIIFAVLITQITTISASLGSSLF